MCIFRQVRRLLLCLDFADSSPFLSSLLNLVPDNLSASIRILPEPDVLLPLQVELHINIQRPDSAIRDLQEHYKTEQVYL